MKKMSVFLIAGALLLGAGSCTTNNNTYVTPQKDTTGTWTNTNTTTTTTTSSPTDIPVPPFTVEDSTWDYLIVGRDTVDSAYFQQDDIEFRGGKIINASVWWDSTSSYHTLPDLMFGTSFSSVQTLKGFNIGFSAQGGYDPGDPGTNTFIMTIEIPAQKMADGTVMPATTKTVIVHTAMQIHRLKNPLFAYIRQAAPRRAANITK